MRKEERKVPELRFKGFHDNWEQRKLGEVFKQTSKFVNPEKENLELWSLTVENGLTPKTARYNRSFLVKKNDKFKTVNNNEFIYNPMNMTLGAVDLNSTGKTVAVSGYYITMITKPNFDSKYFNFWLKSAIAIKNYKIYATGSLIERQRIQFPTLSQIKTKVPSISEQQRIGNILMKLDRIITLHQRKINRLNLLKKEYLNANLRYINKRKIKIRFSGFQKPWKNKKLKKLSPLRGGYAFKSNEFEKTGIPIIRISNILSGGHVGGGFAYYKEQDNDDKYTLPDNAVVLAMSGATTGKVAVLRKDKDIKFYQNQRVGYFTPIDGINYAFISTLVSSPLFRRQLNSVLVAGAQPNVSPKDINNFEFYIPEEIEEQRKIGLFFKRIDKIIVLHQEKLNIIEKFKKQILNKMFI